MNACVMTDDLFETVTTVTLCRCGGGWRWFRPREKPSRSSWRCPRARRFDGWRRATWGYVPSHTVRLISRWALETLQLARLEITCGPDNTSSQRVAQQCGFSHKGLLRSHTPFKGGRRDTVMFSLLPGELILNGPAG